MKALAKWKAMKKNADNVAQVSNKRETWRGSGEMKIKRKRNK